MVKSSKYRGVTLFRPTMKWRAQISAYGKTTSLGDHDTEESAAMAFDRAIINKDGHQAKTNFPLKKYEDEIEKLQAMSHVDVIAMLRGRARKVGTRTSHFRGVSLLKQTNKWHAQINVSGRQVHLGFFNTEDQAARAYDRAAINKGATDDGRGRIITNFDISEYADELDLLRRIPRDELHDALANEEKRKEAFKMMAEGLVGQVDKVLGRKFPATKARSEKDRAALERLKASAERAAPKSTTRNLLYQEFPKSAEDAADADAQPSGEGAVAGGGPVRKGTVKKARGKEAVQKSGPPTHPTPANKVSSLRDVSDAPPPEPAASPNRRRSGQPPTTKRSLFRAQEPATSPVRAQQSIGFAPSTPGSSKAAAEPPMSPVEPHGATRAAKSHARPASNLEVSEPSMFSGPPTPTPKRGRTPMQRVDPPGGSLAALAAAAAKDGRQEVRLTQAEHRRTQAEQRAMVSNLIDHVMARPLTKRQEALAARKQEEAAATLMGGRQPSPLPEEVGVALMDFAAAAELAELEDRQQQAHGGEGTTATLLQNGRAESEDTRSTITFPGQSRHQGPYSDEQTSKRRRGLLNQLGS